MIVFIFPFTERIMTLSVLCQHDIINVAHKCLLHKAIRTRDARCLQRLCALKKLSLPRLHQDDILRLLATKATAGTCLSHKVPLHFITQINELQLRCPHTFLQTSLHIILSTLMTIALQQLLYFHCCILSSALWLSLSVIS